MREFPKIRGTLFWGPIIIRVLLFRVLCRGPLFSETPIYSPRSTRAKLTWTTREPMYEVEGCLQIVGSAASVVEARVAVDSPLSSPGIKPWVRV